MPVYKKPDGVNTAKQKQKPKPMSPDAKAIKIRKEAENSEEGFKRGSGIKRGY